jgi:hypothetical protein
MDGNYMRRIICLALLALLGGAVASCGGGKTVYVTGLPQLTITQTATAVSEPVKTLTQTIDGAVKTSIVTLTSSPPVIPHPPYLESYGCVQCHPFLPGHEGHSSGSSICFACHKLAGNVSGG